MPRVSRPSSEDFASFEFRTVWPNTAAISKERKKTKSKVSGLLPVLLTKSFKPSKVSYIVECVGTPKPELNIPKIVAYSVCSSRDVPSRARGQKLARGRVIHLLGEIQSGKGSGIQELGLIVGKGFPRIQAKVERSQKKLERKGK